MNKSFSCSSVWTDEFTAMEYSFPLWEGKGLSKPDYLTYPTPIK